MQRVDVEKYISDMTRIPSVLRFMVKMWCQTTCVDSPSLM